MEGSPTPPSGAATRLERAGDAAARIGSLQPTDAGRARALHAGIVLVLALGAVFAVVAALGDLPDIDWRLHPWSLLLSVVVLFLGLIANAEIWRRLLRSLGPELDPWRAQLIWFASGLGRYVPTSLLLPMLRVAMSNREGVPKRICAASVIYEVALFLAASVIVGAYFVITLPDLQDNPERFAILAFPLLALVALHPRVFHSLADRALARLGRAPLPVSLPTARMLEFVAAFCATNIVAGVSLYLLAQSIYPVGNDDLAVVVGAYSVGTALSIVAFVLPGGLVAREAGIALALSPVMPAAPALAIAVLSRILQLATEVLMTMALPILLRRRQAREPGGDPTPSADRRGARPPLI